MSALQMLFDNSALLVLVWLGLMSKVLYISRILHFLKAEWKSLQKHAT